MWLAITPIEAQQQLLGFQVSSFPNMKPDDQRKLHKEYMGLANPDMFADSKKSEVTTRELGLILAGKNG